MKTSDQKLTNRWLHYGLMGFLYGTAALTLLIHTVGHAEALDSSHSTIVCPQIRLTRQFTISSQLSLPLVRVNQCNQVRLINTDAFWHQPIITNHHSGSTYPGFEVGWLHQGQTYTFIASQTGQFVLLDQSTGQELGQLLVLADN